MLEHLRKINRAVRNFDQIRASVITHWVKLYDLRKAQYMAGHRYVSSTEDFMFQLTAKELDDWKSQIVTSNKERMGLRKPPLAFTEQG